MFENIRCTRKYYYILAKDATFMYIVHATHTFDALVEQM